MVQNQSSTKADVRRVRVNFCCLLAFLITLDCAVLATKEVFSACFLFVSDVDSWIRDFLVFFLCPDWWNWNVGPWLILYPICLMPPAWVSPDCWQMFSIQAWNSAVRILFLKASGHILICHLVVFLFLVELSVDLTRRIWAVSGVILHNWQFFAYLIYDPLPLHKECIIPVFRMVWSIIPRILYVCHFPTAEISRVFVYQALINETRAH